MLSPTETVQRAYYDGVAARWDLDAYYWMYKEKRERQILLAVEILRAQFSDRSWHRIAQWGGGDALQCEAFARAGCRCVSFDISRAMLRVGQRLAAQHDYGSSLQWVQGTAEGTAPFRDAAFDVNMALSCLNHIHPDRWEVYLRERVRVTAPGGLVFDVVPNLENRALYESRRFHGLRQPGHEQEWLRFVTRDNVCALYAPWLDTVVAERYDRVRDESRSVSVPEIVLKKLTGRRSRRYPNWFYSRVFGWLARFDDAGLPLPGLLWAEPKWLLVAGRVPG